MITMILRLHFANNSADLNQHFM